MATTCLGCLVAHVSGTGLGRGQGRSGLGRHRPWPPARSEGRSDKHPRKFRADGRAPRTGSAGWCNVQQLPHEVQHAGGRGDPSPWARISVSTEPVGVPVTPFLLGLGIGEGPSGNAQQLGVVGELGLLELGLGWSRRTARRPLRPLRSCRRMCCLWSDLGDQRRPASVSRMSPEPWSNHGASRRVRSNAIEVVRRRIHKRKDRRASIGA